MSDFVRRVKQLAKPFASRLRQLDIELTERCNNDCIHCCINLPANDSDAQRREMTAAQVKDILKQASDLDCLQVRFTGGEPLLRPDFEQLYLYARRLGMKVLLSRTRASSRHTLPTCWRTSRHWYRWRLRSTGCHTESYEGVTRAPGSFAQILARRESAAGAQRAVYRQVSAAAGEQA